ncbi:MAG TPA: hypothetical protein VIM12_13580 [Noviherbaspirillum sp.]|jgi:hypothetical protein|uniref:hypothetical protein n=1 Tax=Noviherbaspirillum sp. TaxID=1926288 RepID=UPI002F94A245
MQGSQRDTSGQDASQDAEILALVARLEREPGAAAVLARARKHGQEIVRAMVEETVRALSALEPRPAPSRGAAAIAVLAGEARTRARAAQERKELAVELVYGAIVNADNPDWDPFDPATSRTADASGVLRLLNTDAGTPTKR